MQCRSLAILCSIKNCVYGILRNLFIHNVKFLKRWTSPVAMGGFGGLSPPNKALSLPKSKYETLWIIGGFVNFSYQAPRHKRKDPHTNIKPPPSEDFVATVLRWTTAHCALAIKMYTPELTFMYLFKNTTIKYIKSIFSSHSLRKMCFAVKSHHSSGISISTSEISAFLSHRYGSCLFDYIG